jgi:hypothetical protein
MCDERSRQTALAPAHDVGSAVGVGGRRDGREDEHKSTIQIRHPCDVITCDMAVRSGHPGYGHSLALPRRSPLASSLHALCRRRRRPPPSSRRHHRSCYFRLSYLSRRVVPAAPNGVRLPRPTAPVSCAQRRPSPTPNGACLSRPTVPTYRTQRRLPVAPNGERLLRPTAPACAPNGRLSAAPKGTRSMVSVYCVQKCSFRIESYTSYALWISVRCPSSSLLPVPHHMLLLFP